VPRPGYGWKLGLLFSLVGLLTVFLSTWQYFVVRRDIDEDIYEPADRWVVLFSLAVTLLGAGIIYFVLTSSLISRKKNKFNARYLMLSNFRKF
jgi:putative membrane protein